MRKERQEVEVAQEKASSSSTPDLAVSIFDLCLFGPDFHFLFSQINQIQMTCFAHALTLANNQRSTEWLSMQ